MLERRVGEDMFKRLLERHVVASCHAAHKGARRATRLAPPRHHPEAHQSP